MSVVTPDTLGRSVKTMILSFSRTFHDEAVEFGSLGTNYVIDLNGYIHQNSKHGSSCTVCLLSGDNRFAYEKASREGRVSITDKQLMSLASIMKSLSRFSKSATIEADDQKLYYNAINLFRSYAD